MKKIAVLALFLFTTLMFSQQGTDAAQNPSAQEIKVFPNPATNVINILGLQNSPKASILISDSYGNTLMSYQWEIKHNALNIPIANLDAGIYLISIHSENQKVQKKFIKQ